MTAPLVVEPLPADAVVPPAPLGRPVSAFPSRTEVEAMAFLANTLVRSTVPLPADALTAEAVFAKLLVGREWGLGPMVSIYQIHFIEGKATLPASIQVALVAARGLGRIEVVLSEDDRACVQVSRNDWQPDRHVLVTWTLEDARRAGLLDKKNWRKYPRAMLVARAQTEAIHQCFPDLLAGNVCSPDELGAETDEQGRWVDVEFLSSPRVPAGGMVVSSSSAVPAAPTVSTTCECASSSVGPPGNVTTIGAPAPDSVEPTAPPTLERAPAPLTVADRIAGLVKRLAYSRAAWLEYLARLGVTSLRTMSDAQQQQTLALLQTLDSIRRLRQLVGLNDTEWMSIVLARRRIRNELLLSLADAQQINDKLTDRTPFGGTAPNAACTADPPGAEPVATDIADVPANPPAPGACPAG